jgi:O-antigen/teichoic acid export membrane protein
VSRQPQADLWGSAATDRPLATVARNVSTRYLVIGADVVIGLVMLPFNVAHLGQSAYGLWMLTASITNYFSILDLGYGGVLVRFVAQYRAWRDAAAINQIISTLFFLFAGVGLLTYGVAAVIAFNLDHLFKLAPEQVATGRAVLLIIGLHVAMGFPFSVFGGVINGFQRYDANNMVALASSVTVALVNVAVLTAGYGLVELVAATTTVRLLTFLAYRLNAYAIFPALRVRPGLFRRARLREVSAFSVYNLMIDWANKLNYSMDVVVIGALLGSAAVALWAAAARIIWATQRFTNQLNSVLFPMVVDSDAAGRPDRLREIFLQGTRFSLAMVVLVGTLLVTLASPLIHGWIGPRFAPSAAILQVLAIAVVCRVGNATATTVLKGAGQHRMLGLVSLATGVANLGLSIVLVRRYGLIGAALGTLVPVSLTAALVLFPAACRRVGVPIRVAIRQAILPALWPAVLVAVALSTTREWLPASLLAVGVQGLTGAALYLAGFSVALGRRDRARYVRKIRHLLTSRPVPAAA